MDDGYPQIEAISLACMVFVGGCACIVAIYLLSLLGGMFPHASEPKMTVAPHTVQQGTVMLASPSAFGRPRVIYEQSEYVSPGQATASPYENQIEYR